MNDIETNIKTHRIVSLEGSAIQFGSPEMDILTSKEKWPTLLLTKMTKPQNRILIFRILRESFFRFEVHEASVILDRLESGSTKLGQLPKDKAEELQTELKKYGVLSKII